MAVVAGTDYAIARRTLWAHKDRLPGPVTALLTRGALYLFGRARGGGTPAQVEALLAAPETTAQTLEQTLRGWVEQGTFGSELTIEPMAGFKRVRIFTGWLRRSVALSKLDTGYDLRAGSIKPTKAELPAFIELLRGHPHLELK